MKRLVGDVRLGFAATASLDGTPNVSPKGTTLALDDDHLVFADIRSPGTVANLRVNPAIEVNVVDVGTRRGYRFRGTATVVEPGARYDELLAWYADRGFELAGRATGFVVVRVESTGELLSPAYDSGETEEELLRRYARYYAGLWAERLDRYAAAWPPELYEAHYLAAETLYGASGHGGDAASWEAVRRPIMQGLDRDGTFLDVGCANGLLMESVAAWSEHRIEPYGLDFAPRLVELARRRLPHWADRIFLGDVCKWDPPRRFDFVRTELVYVPAAERRRLVERIVGRVLAPAGALLACGYGGERVAPELREWGFVPDLELTWRSPRSGRPVELVVVRSP